MARVDDHIFVYMFNMVDTYLHCDPLLSETIQLIFFTRY